MTTDRVNFELLHEAMPEVQEHLYQVERELHALVHEPESAPLLASVFRRIHTIKGDFGYCQATPITNYMHQLEEVLQALREGRFQCSALVAEAVLQSLDRIHDMAQPMLDRQRYETLPTLATSKLIKTLACAPNQIAADDASRQVLLAMHGTWLAAPEVEVEATAPPSHDEITPALLLGEQLAGVLARRRPSWQGRAQWQLALLRALNEQYPQPINDSSLGLAVYWHDVGLLALDDASLANLPQPGSATWRAYASHPEHAASWLLTIAPNALEAAQIIRQHHLNVNGKGIAALDYGLPPHPGAQMLACADLAFEHVATLSPEERPRGWLRALFEVSGALDIRFDAQLIRAFERAAQSLMHS